MQPALLLTASGDEVGSCSLWVGLASERCAARTDSVPVQLAASQRRVICMYLSAYYGPPMAKSLKPAGYLGRSRKFPDPASVQGQCARKQHLRLAYLPKGKKPRGLLRPRGCRSAVERLSVLSTGRLGASSLSWTRIISRPRWRRLSFRTRWPSGRRLHVCRSKAKGRVCVNV